MGNFEKIILPSPIGTIQVRRIPDISFTTVFYKGISAHLCELNAIANHLDSAEQDEDSTRTRRVASFEYHAHMKRFRRRNISEVGRMMSSQEAIIKLYNYQLLYPLTRLGLQKIGEGNNR